MSGIIMVKSVEEAEVDSWLLSEPVDPVIPA